MKKCLFLLLFLISPLCAMKRDAAELSHQCEGRPCRCPHPEGWDEAMRIRQERQQRVENCKFKQLEACGSVGPVYEYYQKIRLQWYYHARELLLICRSSNCGHVIAKKIVGEDDRSMFEQHLRDRKKYELILTALSINNVQQRTAINDHMKYHEDGADREDVVRISYMVVEE